VNFDTRYKHSDVPPSGHCAPGPTPGSGKSLPVEILPMTGLRTLLLSSLGHVRPKVELGLTPTHQTPRLASTSLSPSSNVDCLAAFKLGYYDSHRIAR
jgi:hypothetical protein